MNPYKKFVWWGDNYNWGDWVNPWLISKITGINIGEEHRIPLGDPNSLHRYYCIGSILTMTTSDNYEVWGSGLDVRNFKLSNLPKKIHAVRGPLTRKILLEQGIDCPEVYGDPALLLPKYYTPKVVKKYKYGIIPHFSHKSHPWLSNFINDPTVKIIDIQDATITKFIDEVNECEIILSSSLHGIICADAYGVPSYWIDLHLEGSPNTIKFSDYFMSVKRPLVEPISVKWNPTLKDLWPPLYNYKAEIDLNPLMYACPFKNLKVESS